MKSNWFSIYDRGAAAEIYIYDSIGKDWFSQTGIAAKDFAEALKPYAAKDLVVGINSPGGNVFDGIAIANQLAMHRGNVSTRNDGIVASIASVIFLAGKNRTVAENSMTMIHDPSGEAAGRSQDLRAMADTLDQVKNTLADTYVKVSGRSKDDVLAAMASEKRFTAQEMVDWKFANAITPTIKAAASFDLTVFKNHATLFADPVAQLRTDLQNERRKRIDLELEACVTDGKIDVSQKSFWIDLAMKDESVLAHVKAHTPNLQPGPINVSLDQSGNTSADRAWNDYRARLDKFRNVKR